MGVEEWRIPVGRAETTRKGEGEEEGVADDDNGNNTRKRERGEEERERRDQGRHNAVLKLVQALDAFFGA